MIMNTRRPYAITLIALFAGVTASCDALPVTPEMSAPATVPAVAESSSDRSIAVEGETPHRFQFEIALMDEGARALRTRILAQADRWARIVEGSDLEDIAVGAGHNQLWKPPVRLSA